MGYTIKENKDSSYNVYSTALNRGILLKNQRHR